MDSRSTPKDRDPALVARARAAYERTVNPNTKGRALSQAERDAIAEALDALTQQTRDIFLAVRIEGLSYRQIADRFGVTEEQVQQDLLTTFRSLCRALKHPPRPSRWRRLLRMLKRTP